MKTRRTDETKERMRQIRQTKAYYARLARKETLRKTLSGESAWFLRSTDEGSK